MPPRAQRLYPRMRERPPEFRVNPGWPIYGQAIVLSAPASDNTHVLVVPDGVARFGGNGRHIDWSDTLRRHVYRVGEQATDDVLIVPSFNVPYRVAPLTISCFVRIDRVYSSYANVIIAAYGTSEPYPGFGVARINGLLSVWDSSEWRSSVAINLGTLAHLCAVFTGTKLLHYYDGTNVAEFSSTGPSYSAVDMCVGARVDLSFRITGIAADVIVCHGVMPPSYIAQLADRSNVDLRIGGIPLILPPRRRLWPVAPVAEYIKRRQLGLRVGSREVVI